jgi:hypothetical protein
MDKKFYSPKFGIMQRYLHSTATTDAWRQQGSNGWGGRPEYVFTDVDGQIKPVADLVESVGPKTLLDYGCGKGYATDRVADQCATVDVRKFDPFVKPYTKHPTEPCDMVMCISVLQQIESDYIIPVIDDLYDLTLKNLFVEVIVNKELLETAPDLWVSRFNRFKILFTSISPELQVKRPAGI